MIPTLFSSISSNLLIERKSWMLFQRALQEEIDVWSQSWVDGGQILGTCSPPANKHYSTLFKDDKQRHNTKKEKAQH